MSESREEYFERQNNWEEHFETLDDFIENLNTTSNSSGSLGRISAKTIARLSDKLKWAYCKEIGSDSIVGLDCCDDYKDWCEKL
jgi:hypothetical protein